MTLKVDSIQFAVQEKDLELLETQRKLDEVNSEVIELQQLINSKEDQLVQVRTELQDKEQCIQLMQDELDKMRLGRSQAESVVQKIVELTGNLIGSVEGEEVDIYSLLDDEILSTSTALESNLHKHNQLKADIDMLKESLRQKDMDLSAAYKALDAKDRELKAVVGRLDIRDKELDKLEELSIDPYDIRRLSSIADEATKDNIVGEVELQKHELESVEAEALAASTLLKKLANVTKELLRSGRTDSGTNLVASQNSNISEGASKMEPQRKINVILEAKKEIVGLFSLTEELVAGAQMKDAEEP
jgi:TolA-binding protein